MNHFLKRQSNFLREKNYNIIEETGAVKKSVGDWKITSSPLEWFHRHPKLGVRIGSAKIKFHIIKVDYSQISTLEA